MISGFTGEPEVLSYRFGDDGRIPNNPHLPLLVYRGALPGGGAEGFEGLFRGNGWDGMWRDGIFGYHHYHSTAHEVLGVARGAARVTFGGEGGVTLEVGVGDAVVIPAGVGHCNRGASRDLLVVGAYPVGQSWDLCTGEPGERPRVLENIRRVPLPERDPLFGEGGPLIELWGEG
ncbi:hypothetical protein RxyAA322_18310 [Rubrobacter xylanophilus]|uniref:Cupin type-2 domain-containing protein n=1 Tax=Rubrobacter xylanophilus TaxID=49319 RepID=A0A510HN93_9ACTN|nr:cupin domain-containing protein [Rubrobacter xylanophilus]BBL79977.1 hypothetical protein RxyAA322_18310 [Rubrobacter xylanophilus]